MLQKLSLSVSLSPTYSLHSCLILFSDTKHLSLPTLLLPSMQPFAILHTLTTSGLITIIGLMKNYRSNFGLIDHKNSLGAPLCPCRGLFCFRHYDDKDAEVGQGFWNCPCVPMKER
ncbi:uncharacterized protein LOC114304857 [Camellia sinensis]|uniref:uncharacterized protein LOC114304857 n=1 Tax=Camellia sinensis TaxID=4442 RepID=UPI001035808F|nr:uncharacterized protein LOC114304857 [Camellia sinensis]